MRINIQLNHSVRVKNFHSPSGTWHRNKKKIVFEKAKWKRVMWKIRNLNKIPKMKKKKNMRTSEQRGWKMKIVSSISQKNRNFFFVFCLNICTILSNLKTIVCNQYKTNVIGAIEHELSFNEWLHRNKFFSFFFFIFFFIICNNDV